MPGRVPALALAGSLLATAQAHATTAADLCPAAADPCILAGVLAVAPGSVLDFGGRALRLAPGARLGVEAGEALVLRARTVTLEATASIRGEGAAVTVEAAEDVELLRSGAGRSRIDVSGAEGGGQIEVVAGRHVAASGDLRARAAAVGGDGGGVGVQAGGDVTLAGDVLADGGRDGAGGSVAIGAGGALRLQGVVDVSAGVAGDVDLAAGGPLSVTGRLDLQGDGPCGDGGLLTLSGGADVAVGGPVLAGGTGGPVAGGCLGGTVEIAGGATVRLGARIDVSSAGPGAEGGTVDVLAGIDLVQTHPVLAQARGDAGVGGIVTLAAARRLTASALVDAHGGYAGGGGFVALEAGAEVQALAEVHADGDGGAVLVTTAREGRSEVGGPVTVGGHLHARGTALGPGGLVTVAGCDVEVARRARLTVDGPGAGNTIEASGRLNLAGSLQAGAFGGANVLRYRDAGTPPVVQASASLAPPAAPQRAPGLPPCGPVCGDGVVAGGEDCDEGPRNGLPGAGCDVLCRVAVVCGPQPRGACVPCLDDADCHPMGRCAGFACVEGACRSAAPLRCEDGNPCTLDACDAEAGCVATPIAGPGVPGCDDGDACNGAETCAGAACVPGPPPPADDGDPCTDDDVCDPVLGYPRTPRAGVAGVACRLEPLDAALAAAGPDDASRRVRRRLAGHLAKVRARLAQAERAAGRRRLARLAAADARLERLRRVVASGLRRGELAPALAERLGSAVAGARGALGALRAGPAP